MCLMHIGVAVEEMGRSAFVFEADAPWHRVAEDCWLAATASSSLKLLLQHVVFVYGYLLLEVDWLEAFFLSWSGIEVLSGFPVKRQLLFSFSW